MESRTKSTHTIKNTIYDSNNVRHNDDKNCASIIGQEHQRVAVLPSWFVIQLTVTASLGGCLFGYDMGG